MATKTLDKTPVPKAPLPEVWEHTHTVGEVPVMRVAQPFAGKYNPEGRLQGFPLFYDSEWKQVYLAPGRKAVPLSPPESPASIEEMIELRPEEEYHDAFEGTQLELLDVDVAYAVLCAAAWPCYAESWGYKETLNGCSATVIGKTQDGDKIVNVCVPGRTGGNFVKVIVPRLIGFQIAED